MTDILINNQERSDARGLGNTVPSAPPGLSRSDWGFECKAHAVRSDARGLGNTVPSAPPNKLLDSLGVQPESILYDNFS